MKKILSVLMALIMALSAVQCLSVVSFAADESETAVAEDHGEVVKSGNCGEKDENGDFSSNVTYELYEDGTLVISGNGAMPDFSYDEWVYEEIDNPYASYIVSEEYDYYIDRTIKAVKVEEGVTKIGANAFVSFVNLASVELPESITGIGASAFYQCHAIESINIPDSVTYIKESAFAGCSGLKSLTIPKGVGSFGVGAFSGCTNLESVEFEGNTYISACCFYACNKLKTLILPATLEFIDSAFYNCNSLSDIYYNGTEEQWNSIRIVDRSNDALRNATIHYNYNPCDHNNTTNHDEQAATCTEDGYTAGIYCEDCGKWIFGHAVIKKHHTDKDADNICDLCGEATRIAVKSGNCGASIYDDDWGEEIVGNEDNAQFVLYDDGTLVISGSGSLGGFGYGMDDELPSVPYASYSRWYDEEEDWDTYFDDTVKSVIIEDGITAIGNNAFYRFRSLESIVIPDSVTRIGSLAFFQCNRLESVSIPDSVETIDYNAFGFGGIKEISLPASVQSVDVPVFSGCSNLSTITVNNPECDIFDSNIPYETEIHGYKYSTAYDFVLENGNSFVQIGEAKELESISISSMPSYKTTYKQGSSFRQDELIVTLRFTDGTSVDKTRGFTVSGFDSSEIGSCTLTVTYEDKTATFDVEIIENKEYVINSGETIQVDVESDIMTYIKFVPTIDGTFTFTLYDEGEMPYAYLYDADKNTLVYGDDSASITYNFETGKTYYLGVNCCAVGFYPIDVNLTCDKVICAHENTTEHDEQPATCTEDGITAGTYCEDCGRWISGHKKIVKHHVDEDGDGICDVCKDEFKTVIKQGNCGAPIYDEDDEIVGYEDVNYDLYDNGLLVISGEGEMYNYSSHGYAPYADYLYDYISGVDYDNTVKAVVIENGVTSVGDYAFSGFRSLSSVTIPESVTRIGGYAFSGCTALDNVNIPDSVGSIGISALTKELSFVPATAYAFHEGVSDGNYDTDDDGESYYNYSHPDFENGDKLTVRNIDGTETEYTLKDGYFEAENADRIDAGDLWFRSNQYQNHWFPDGEYNYMTLKFGAAFCTVPVAVYDNPVESISVTLTSPYVLMDRISSDKTVHFRTGDVLTVNYTDGTSKEFICRDYEEYWDSEGVYYNYIFTSSDGEKLNRVRINRDGDFSVGMNAATVNYAGKTCDFPVEVTQCTVESISASYRYTLYNGYDCQLDTCEEHDEWCTSEEYINDAYVLYSVNLTDGSVFTGTQTEVYEEFGARPRTHIVLDRIGTNEGSVTLGDFIGVFTVNVEEKPSEEENLPTCYFNSFNLNFAVGQKVDYQLIQFADKGYTHSINVISIPDGLTLSQDGRLTGTVTGESGWYSLEFDVRWDDTYVHEHYRNSITICDASEAVEIPDDVELIPYDEIITVEASTKNPKWFKFRACYSNINIGCSEMIDSGGNFELYDSNGILVDCDGIGDADLVSHFYQVTRGDYYYIRVHNDCELKVYSPSWLPVWDEDDNLGGRIDYSLVETNAEKEFDGDSNTLWNVYKLEMPFHVDTNGGITYDIFGAMARFASPVNIHIASEATSNLEILNKKSYKFDPNNVEECEAIGASTEQDTLIDKLLPGEKEYRFDTVYYLMPEVADFDLVQTSLLYVPVGYALTDDDGIGRITESCTHGNTETVTENEVPATCKEGGSYDSVTYCKNCGVELSRETVTTPKKAHTESAWITDKASDCVNGGTKHTECTVCGEILQTAEIPANGHSYESVVTAPTCTADGYTTHTCKVCGERYTDTIVDKLGHSFKSYVSNNDATCTADGTKTAKCDRCDETDTVADAGSAKGHTPAEAVTENEVPATCTANGSYDSVVYCSVCHTEISREAKTTDKLGHRYESVVTAPTCTADGYTTHTCKVCGERYTDTIVDKLGHRFTNYVSNNDATCTADGTKTAKCDRCDATDTVADTGSAKGHTPAEAVTENEVPATCTANGSYDSVVYCSVCHTEISREAKTTDKLGHRYESVVTAPTCTADGYTTHTCSVCGNAYTDSVVKAKGHTEKTAVTKATTSKDGKIVTTCAVCGESLGTTVIYKASSIKLSATKYTYDGKTKTPTVTVKDSKGNTLKKGTDYTVKYATGRKNTGKYTVTVTFNGNYTGSKTLSFNILPGKTSKLTATQTTSSVKATWKSVTGASGYKVTLYSAKNKTIKTVYTTKTSASFTKLSKGTTYKVKVTAYKTIDGKKVTSSVSTLLTTATKPGTPTLKATAGTKKATLSWNKQTGAAGYVVYMSTSKFGKYTKIATVKGGSKVSFTKTGLTKGKTYYFKVAAFETVGGKTIYGDYSAVKSVKVK